MDRTLRDIRGDDRPFGGITVVFGGDYQQTLPIIPQGSREDIINAILQNTLLWERIEVLCLNQNMRVRQNSDAEEFSRWLLDIGHGRAAKPENCPPSMPNTIALPERMLCASISDLINSIYADIAASGSPPPPEYFAHRVILVPRNDEVHALNIIILDLLPGERCTFNSADSFSQDTATFGSDPLNLPVEFLNSLNSSGIPLSQLHLKVGCPVILLRNPAPLLGLCNGSRATVLRMSERVIEVRLMGGEHDGEIAFIPRITLSPSDNNTDFAIKLKQRQFPIHVAFSMTINKAQGQSVKHVGIDLRAPVFAHGQLYVAFSRAASFDHVKVLLPDDTSVCGTPNVVYPEVLID